MTNQKNASDHQPQQLGRGTREPDARTWGQRVHDVALGNPRNIVTLHRLRDIEQHIHHEAAAVGKETIEQVEAIALVCAYKLQILKDIEQAREEARERAYREGRVRYVD